LGRPQSPASSSPHAGSASTLTAKSSPSGLQSTVDGTGAQLLVQRAHQVDEQDRRLGQDTYCPTPESAAAVYGGVGRLEVVNRTFTVELEAAAAGQATKTPHRGSASVVLKAASRAPLSTTPFGPVLFHTHPNHTLGVLKRAFPTAVSDVAL
jgi:hypothetical protein